jgi:hypothetical protein
MNAPAAFIHPCQPIVAKQPPSGPGWAHELKHDGYRLQIHARDGRVRLYTITGADRSKRYPLIRRGCCEDGSRLSGNTGAVISGSHAPHSAGNLFRKNNGSYRVIEVNILKGYWRQRWRVLRE